jgi:hypothetical protein
LCCEHARQCRLPSCAYGFATLFWRTPYPEDRHPPTLTDDERSKVTKGRLRHDFVMAEGHRISSGTGCEAARYGLLATIDEKFNATVRETHPAVGLPEPEVWASGFPDA